MARPTTTRTREKGLRILRIRANLTQCMLSKLSGVPQSLLSNYERGLTISPSHLDLLWDAIIAVVDPEEITKDDLDRFYPDNPCGD